MIDHTAIRTRTSHAVQEYYEVRFVETQVGLDMWGLYRVTAIGSTLINWQFDRADMDTAARIMNEGLLMLRSGICATCKGAGELRAVDGPAAVVCPICKGSGSSRPCTHGAERRGVMDILGKASNNGAVLDWNSHRPAPADALDIPF